MSPNSSTRNASHQHGVCTRESSIRCRVQVKNSVMPLGQFGAEEVRTHHLRREKRTRDTESRDENEYFIPIRVQIAVETRDIRIHTYINGFFFNHGLRVYSFHVYLHIHFIICTIQKFFNYKATINYWWVKLWAVYNEMRKKIIYMNRAHSVPLVHWNNKRAEQWVAVRGWRRLCGTYCTTCRLIVVRVRQKY